MDIRIFTPQDYPAIIAIHNSQNILWPEWPRTPEALAEADSRLSQKSRHRRQVGVEDSRVVGIASYTQHPWSYLLGAFM